MRSKIFQLRIRFYVEIRAFHRLQSKTFVVPEILYALASRGERVDQTDMRVTRYRCFSDLFVCFDSISRISPGTVKTTLQARVLKFVRIIFVCLTQQKYALKTYVRPSKHCPEIVSRT